MSHSVTCPSCNHTFTHTSTKSTRPGPGTITGKVWDTCDLLTTQGGSKVTRKVVLSTLLGQGLNPSTILTQYQAWSKSYNLLHPTFVPPVGESVVTPEV